jgi:hypothetical protein
LRDPPYPCSDEKLLSLVRENKEDFTSFISEVEYYLKRK